MARHGDEIKAALARLREVAQGGAPTDVYLTASEYRGEKPAIVDLGELDPDSLMYYGGQNPGQLLAQFTALHTGRKYDAILVLTDDSGYQLGPSDLAVSTPGAPVWMVHLGGFPLGYDDPTLAAIQASGGGVASTVDEALTRLMIARAAGQSGESQAPLADIIDGYVWLTVSTGAAAPLAGGEVVTHAPGDDFAAFAARRLILAAMQRQRAMLDDPEVLDTLHATAIEHSIVTPFSSMIVLVNEEQQRRLDALEQQDDRFQREREDVGETTPEPPTVTGVPEPEEWLLIGLAALMLLWYVRSSQGLRIKVKG
jgi:putative PEP-CTERM system integral membrane protein